MAGRCLGIDFGERRIGLAISDENRRIAVPLAVLERRNDATAVREIEEVVQREGVTSLVLGEPVGLDGEAGISALRVRSFAGKLTQATGMTVEMIPETLTSVDAEDRLRALGRRARRGAVDAVAAQIVLQEALDRRPGSA